MRSAPGRYPALVNNLHGALPCESESAIVNLVSSDARWRAAPDEVLCRTSRALAANGRGFCCYVLLFALRLFAEHRRVGGSSSPPHAPRDERPFALAQRDVARHHGRGLSAFSHCRKCATRVYGMGWAVMHVENENESVGHMLMRLPVRPWLLAKTTQCQTVPTCARSPPC
jgi:hypothetical protein